MALGRGRSEYVTVLQPSRGRRPKMIVARSVRAMVVQSRGRVLRVEKIREEGMTLTRIFESYLLYVLNSVRSSLA